MALPQNPLSDRQLFDTLKTQNESLSAQTKVLHKLSDNISDQRKDFAALRKDIQDAQKELLRGNNKGMSEIQKYFAKYKTDNKSGKVGEKDQSTGFFKGIINKIFGPSKYQQKMIDEITRTRELTESTALDINFIRKQNEEGPRARERELLAQLIADKINANNNNASTDDKGSSLLGTLGKFGAVLISGVGTLLTALGATVVAGLGVGWRILAAIGELISGYFQAKGFGGGAGGAPAGGPRTSTPGSTMDPTQQRLPGKETPQIEGPSKPKDMGTLKQDSKGVYTAGGSLAGRMAGALAGKGPMATMLAAAIGVGAYYKDEIIDIFDNLQEKKEKIDAQEQGKSMGEIASEKLNSLKNFFTDPLKSEDEKRKGEQADVRKIDNAIEAKLKEPVTDFNSAMKAVIIGLMGLEDKLEEAADSVYESTQKFLEPKLNKLGELDFGNGQTLNLLPNLGTAAFATLKEVWDETKDLAKEATNATGDVINNVITQNMKESAAQLAPVAMESMSVTAGMKASLMANKFRF
jgi:hypothetical protein